jgi:ubiquitin C-terminal hydrolase
MNNYNKNCFTGLNNLGNTCFFNSILQLLVQCTILNKLLLLNQFEGNLILYYKEFIDLYNNNICFSPSNIVTYVSKKLNRIGYSQDDADQYLNYIIDTLISETKEYIEKNNLEKTIIHKNYSLSEIIDNLFTIKINKSIICPNCNYISKTNDNINNLYLSINNNSEINELINEYLQEEYLDEDNKYKCEKCLKYVNAKIERQINILPKYLIITLKRYNNLNQKINKHVNMEDEIILYSKKYSLRGVVYHSGSTGGGHYVYYGKKSRWCIYNDNSVNDITENDLNFIKSIGYIYLYVSI